MLITSQLTKTAEIDKRLQKTLAHCVKIKMYEYPQTVERAGEGCAQRVAENPAGSLAAFYEYCFEQASSDYLMKCDAHCVFTPRGVALLQQKVAAGCSGVKFRGAEIYGRLLSCEPSLFQKNSGYEFYDDELYERLRFKKNTFKVIEEPVFIHLKRLNYVSREC